MTVRAFIVAIEDYPDSHGMAQHLPGTNDGADAFWQWLVGTKKLDKADIIGCVDKAFAWRTTGTTRDEILAALETLVSTGRDDTAELYFFFSGHGFSYTDMGWTRAVDVLVASDFISQAKSGGSCIKLQEIQEKLWSAMGPGDHYYFIDACSNTTTHAKSNVLDTGLIFDPSELGKPYRYTLYSTIKGRVAEVESGFADALAQGLKGAGRAKGWQEDNSRMYVKFDLLVDYVERKLSAQAIDPAKDGNGKGLILELNPPPESECIVKIINATPTDKFELVAKTTFGKQGPFTFQGDTYAFKLLPYLYNIEVTHPATEVVRLKPPPPGQLDLYDPCEVEFKKAAGAATHSPQISTLLISQPETPNSELTVENLETGAVFSERARPLNAGGSALRRRGFGMARRASGKKGSVRSAFNKVEPGTYLLRLRERGVVVSRQKVTINPGDEVSVDLLEHPKSKVKEAILKAVANDPKARVAVFSEKYLGSTANWDLGLWLSIFGAARIVGSENKQEFGKLKNLALDSFADISKDESCVYVLAGFERSQGDVAIGVSRQEKVNWELLRKVKGLTSIYQWRAQTKPGANLLSLQLPGQVPSTFATYCLPNRATFVVFAEDEAGRLRVSQYLLPINHLIEHLAPKVRERLDNPLSLVRYIFLAQSQFARKRSLEPEGSSEEARMWMELVYGKWLDPVMSLLAAYYFIRRGAAAADPKGNGPESKMNRLLSVMLHNLREYFAGLPDIEAIGKLCKESWQLPTDPPLLLDGVLAFGESECKKMLPLPLGQLDFSGPWTAWRGAVKAFKSPTKRSATSKRSVATSTRRIAGKGGAKKAAAKPAAKRGAAAKKATGKKRA